MIGWLKKKKFHPPNEFAALVYQAVLRYIDGATELEELSKMDCYMFYSTYINLLASFSTEGVEFAEEMLLDGISDYKKYLKLDDTSFTSGFGMYRVEKAVFYTEVIQERIDSLNGKLTTISLLSFETGDSFGMAEKNFLLINNSFNHFLSGLRNRWLWDVTIEPCDFFIKGSFHIDNLVALPFCLPLCQNCGELAMRSGLEMSNVDTEKGARRMPICLDCRIKLSEDGRII